MPNKHIQKSCTVRNVKYSINACSYRSSQVLKKQKQKEHKKRKTKTIPKNNGLNLES